MLNVTGEIEQQCDSLTFTATGDNDRLLQTAYEPSHLDLRCLTVSLSTSRINFFSSDNLLKKKSRRQISSEI